MKMFIEKYKSEIIIFFIVLISRLLLIQTDIFFHSIDGVNFLLSIDEFNIDAQRPHLPGYIFYVYILKFVSIFFQPNSTLLIYIQIIFQAISSFILLNIFKNKFSNSISYFNLALIFSFPIVVIYSLVPEIYSIDLLIISIYLYLFYNKKIYTLLPYIALIMGIRQSSGFLLLPSFIYFFIINYKLLNINKLKIMFSFLIFIVINILWFLPTINNLGGLETYFEKMDFISQLNSGASLRYRIVSFLSFNLFLFISIILLFIKSNKKSIRFLNKENIFLLLIILPQLLLFVFYHYNKGYILFTLPPIIILINNILNFNKKIVLSVILFNLSIFFFFPTQKPPFNTQLASLNREMSYVDYWGNKFLYFWSSSYGVIDINIKLHNDIIKNKNKILNIVKKDNLIINNSLLISASQISIILPEVNLLELTYYSEFAYERRKNYLEFERKNDIRKVISNSYVLIDKDYRNKFHKNSTIILYETDYYYLVKVNDNNIAKYLETDRLNFIGI